MFLFLYGAGACLSQFLGAAKFSLLIVNENRINFLTVVSCYKKRPLQNIQFCSSSCKAKFLTEIYFSISRINFFDGHMKLDKTGC